MEDLYRRVSDKQTMEVSRANFDVSRVGKLIDVYFRTREQVCWNLKTRQLAQDARSLCRCWV
jgi:hypothetical protein